MITEKEDETRIQYLMRVLEQYMRMYGRYEVQYDGTTCDGQYLADDIKTELDMLGLVEMD